MRSRPVSRLVLVLVALYTVAGGYVHLQQWLDGYRHIPGSVAGSWVVRIGFPVNAAAAVLIGALLVVVAVRQVGTKLALAAAIGLNVSTLAILVATRVGSVFGWMEPVWTPGANQARAVAIGAVVLAVIGVAQTIRPIRATRVAEAGTVQYA